MHTDIKTALGLAGTLTAALPAAGATPAERPVPEPKPNVIIIYTDDMGYSDLSCYGETRWQTPAIDRMAAEGVRFTDFYSASSLSSPSRAALLTGRYPARMGVNSVFFPTSYTGMPPEEVTIAEMLRNAGYATAAVGKWHLGHRDRFLPLQQGFDEYFGLPYSNDMAATVYLRGNEVEEFHIDQRYMTRTYTREAVSFIERSAGKPFFLYLAHNMPHVPLFVSPEFEGRTGAGLYGDVIAEIDWSVDEVLQALDRLGIAGRTLVIFASDNGPWLQEGPLAGTARPLREGKMTEYEGGMRVPCIVRWPGHTLPGVNRSVASMLDWFPTIAAACGATLPDVPLDGYDITGVLTGTGERPNQDFAYFHDNREVSALRSGDWKIVLPGRRIEGSFWREPTPAHDTLLFNLRQNPGETVDYSHKYPKKRAEMAARLEAFKQKMGSPAPRLVVNGHDQIGALRRQRQQVLDEARREGIPDRRKSERPFTEAR